MTGPVGVGVIGAGVISTQYLPNLRDAADVEVRMLADLDLDRAAARADEYGVPASGGVDELLARDDIEIVVNLTIPAAHASVGIQALEAGKHVFAEKPFALDLASATELRDAARRTGRRVASAPDTILGAGLQTARRLIASGAIGDPLTGLGMFQVSGPESWHPSPEFLYARGGGPLFDMGPYYLSWLVELLGPVTRVVGRGSTSHAERVIGSGPKAGQRFPVEVPTHVAGLLDFAGGASAQVVFSFQSALARSGVLELTGTEGALVLPDPNNFTGDATLWRAGSADGETITPQGSLLSRGHGVVDLARAIRDDRPERASGDLAFHVLEVMLALQASAEHGDAVAIASTVTPSAPLPDGWDPLARTL